MPWGRTRSATSARPSTPSPPSPRSTAAASAPASSSAPSSMSPATPATQSTYSARVTPPSRPSAGDPRRDRPAPNPSSMLDAPPAPAAHEDSMESRAVTPPNAVAVADARRHADHRRGAPARPRREASAASWPATTTTQSARSRSPSGGRQAVQAGHAGVRMDDDLRAEELGAHARLGHHRPVRGAAGDDGDQAARRRHRAGDPGAAAPARPRSRPGRRAAAPPGRPSSARVTSTLPAPASSSAAAMASISSGVLPSARMASGAPWRCSRSVSTRAKPRSRKPGPARNPGSAPEPRAGIRPEAGFRSHRRSSTQSMHAHSACTSAGSTAGNIPTRSWLRPSLR